MANNNETYGDFEYYPVGSNGVELIIPTPIKNKPNLPIIDVARYSLNSYLGALYISKPIGWDDDSQVFKRSSENHGVFVSLANNLSFGKGTIKKPGGYSYLKKVFEEKGINAEVILKKDEYVNGSWINSYIGYFDFSTFRRTKNQISMMFNETGIYKNIKARLSEDIELGREETMSGNKTSALPERKVFLDGRKILIINEYNMTDGDGQYSGEAKGFNFRLNKKDIFFYFNAIRNIGAIPLLMKQEVDGNAQTVYEYLVQYSGRSGFANGKTSNCFYADALNTKTLKVDVNVDVYFNKVDKMRSKARFIIIKYKNGITYDFDSLALDTGFVDIHKGDYMSVGLKEYEIPVIAGDSLCFAIEVITYNPAINKYSVDFTIQNAYLAIIDSTYTEPTYTKVVMPHEALNSMLEVITDKKNALKSKALGRKEIGYEENGEAAYTSITNGFKVRQFEDKKIKTSLKQFLESYYTTSQLGFGIERINGVEIFRFEHVNHFYQDFVFLKLGVVSDIERTVKQEYAYASVEVGYSKPSGDSLYEEAMGLDEYNLKSNFTTPIISVDNKLILNSPYRADSYGIEFARRKPFATYFDTDTRYDEDVMLIDLKENPGFDYLLTRKWSDDFIVPSPFNKATTGVYSPESAFNLRLTPASLLHKSGYWISACLKHYRENYVRYSSSAGNSLLKKKEIGTDLEISENGNVLIKDLKISKFNIETIKFNYKISSEMLKEVKGYRIVDGDKIMNVYGLVEFINEDNYYEYGYLVSLEPSGKGKFELLSSNKAKHRVKNFGASKKNINIGPLSYYAEN